MNLYSSATIRYLKEKYGFRLTKSLGQNFLQDPAVIREMIDGSEIGGQDLIIEIGPGIGVLTAAAAEAAGRVAAIEVDRRLLPILAETLQGYGNVEVICQDILKTDLNRLIREKREAFGITGRTRIIGNLPYYITTPIVMKLLQDGVDADSITVMMQKEIADRIEAAPGSRDCGAITVAVQYYAQVSRIARVPKEAFYPRPKVDSAVLHLRIREEKAVSVRDEELFFACVRAGFGQRRKNLSNALSAGFGRTKDEIRTALSAVGIRESRRAETLSMDEFAAIANEMAEMIHGR